MKVRTSFSLLGIACISLYSLVAEPSPTSSQSLGLSLTSVPDSNPASPPGKIFSSPTPVILPPPSPTGTPVPSAIPGPTSIPSEKQSSAKHSSKLIPKQKIGTIAPEILKLAAIEPLSIVVSLSKQRAYLLVGGKVAIDSPISSGRKDGWTPTGEFTILEKDPSHYSNLYGDFINGSGKIVRTGISSKLDVAPSGTHYRGAPMKYFMRLTPEGVGMHAGILPGYPASHGCIRLPPDMARLIYNTVPVKTPVSVIE